ncbi:MAG: hypothetical protein JW963_24865 [Anaerolineales bacterium]|nr:hypothetical protein [Anaerolineales bacterium]
MKNKFHYFIIIFLFLTACQTQCAPVASPPALEPDPTPTSKPAFTPTPTDLFGALDADEVQPGLMLEPVVAQIFEAEMGKRVEAGEIEAFQVESLGVYPKGDGMLYAEVFYRVQAGETFWPEDGGTLGEAGWVTGKCSRFDFLITPDEYQLKNKRLCS